MTYCESQYWLAQKNKIRQDFLTYLSGKLKPNYFATLTFNRDVNYESVRLKLKHLFAGIDAKLYGKGFYKYELGRVDAFAFHEHINSNYHIHTAIKVLKRHQKTLENSLPAIWQRLVPSGDTDLQFLPDANSRMRACSYLLKETYKKEVYDMFTLSREFWPHKRHTPDKA